MMKKSIGILLVMLCASVFSAEETFVSFGRGKWDRTKWLEIKCARHDYLGKMVQKEDHICNWTPDVPPEEVYRKHCDKVYSSILWKEKLEGGKITVSSRMSFDHRMAPLIVIAEEPGKSAAGIPELRKHYEIVLYDKGINIWSHDYVNGRQVWYKAAFFEARFLPNRIYELKVTMRKLKNIMEMTVECDGHKFGIQNQEIPAVFYAGITGCEGRNSFYDFRIKKECSVPFRGR